MNAPGVASAREAPAAPGAAAGAAAARAASFRDGRARRACRSPGAARPAARREVMLWADTFNNYFHPETSRAALEVLRPPGLRVTVPRERLCCGRPLVRLRHARSGEGLSAAGPRRSRAHRSTPACRWSCSSRAAPRCFATSCATCSRPTRAPSGCEPDVPAQRVPRRHAPASSRRSSSAACCSTATAITRR